MKTLLSLGCITACALLVGCGGGSADSGIASDQVRPTTSEQQVAPPGSGVKLGSNNTPAAAARPKSE